MIIIKQLLNLHKLWENVFFKVVNACGFQTVNFLYFERRRKFFPKRDVTVIRHTFRK